MNQRINGLLNQIEAFLLGSIAIHSYHIVRREVSVTDGKFRLRANFVDQSQVELFLYVLESAGQMHLQKYSLHWQDSAGKLLRRWDNAPHYPQLPGAPHHIHHADGSVAGVSTVPDLLNLLDQIVWEISQ